MTEDRHYRLIVDIDVYADLDDAINIVRKCLDATNNGIYEYDIKKCELIE